MLGYVRATVPIRALITPADGTHCPSTSISRLASAYSAGGAERTAAAGALIKYNERRGSN